MDLSPPKEIPLVASERDDKYVRFADNSEYVDR